MSIKTIRFGPLEGFGQWDRKQSGDLTFTPGEMGEDGFPVGTYEDIPEGTRLRIETMPRRECIFDDKVEHSYTRNFDPGKYAYMLKRDFPVSDDDPKPRCFRFQGVFLVDMTETQFKELQNIKPRYAKARMTSDGPLWQCSMPGCTKKSGTRMAAFLHESNVHFGIDPLKDPARAKRIEAGLAKPITEPMAEEAPRRRPGRPPKREAAG